MKSLSKKEFESECLKLQFRGKCAVLLINNKMQDINKVTLDHKDSKLSNLEELKESVSEHITGVLVNFQISSNFSFFKVEKIMYEILKCLPEEANITITATYDESKEIDSANISIVLSQRSNIIVLFSKLFKI